MMRWTLIVLSMVIAISSAYAETVQIKSESLVVKHKSSLAQFNQNVWLKRADFELRCDRLIVRYRQEMGGEVERAEAYGNVVMLQGDKRGTASKAVYQQVEGMLTLIGHAEVQSPDGLIQGEKILHNINTKETVVQQGDEGERARFTIEEDDLNRVGKTKKPMTDKDAP
jgi:lipopolysaccharide export system protein LptA